MRMLRLGNVNVSGMALGCMLFGSKVGRLEAFALLDAYWAAGGRFLDTANCYAFWLPGCSGDESERLLGEWMEARGLRGQAFVATKVGARPLGEGIEPLTREVIRASVERSLRNLRTDSLDLLYAHRDDRDTPLEDTLAAFDGLVREGKVRQLGASNFKTWRLERARALTRAKGYAPLVCVQQRHTYLRPNPGSDFWVAEGVTEDLLDYARSEGDLTILAYTPLLRGAYVKGNLPPQFQSEDSRTRMENLRKITDELGVGPNAVVLAWMMQSGIVPVVSASSLDQLEENLAAASLELTAEQMRILTELPRYSG